MTSHQNDADFKTQSLVLLFDDILLEPISKMRLSVHGSVAL